MKTILRKSFPLDPQAEAMLGIIDAYTSPRVTSVMGSVLLDFTARVQNDMCDRVFDYVYYCGQRGLLGERHADAVLNALYDLHDQYLVQEANRSLAPGYYLPESWEDDAERAHCHSSLLPDETELLIKCITSKTK